MIPSLERDHALTAFGKALFTGALQTGYVAGSLAHPEAVKLAGGRR